MNKTTMLSIFLLLSTITSKSTHYHYHYSNSYKLRGTVKWYDDSKGFGFIAPEDGGKDILFHHSDIRSDEDNATLSNGQSVEYVVRYGRKGPAAKNVIPR